MAEPDSSSAPFTYSDYLQWDSESRYELLDGEARAMSPAPGLSHQAVLMELSAQLCEQLRESPCQAFVAPLDVRLPEGDEADGEIRTVVQPDLMVVCDADQLDERGCKGASDWVIEILSPASAAHDQIRKRQIYERHGVREYWLVHPTDRLVTIYRLGDDGAFARPVILETVGETA